MDRNESAYISKVEATLRRRRSIRRKVDSQCGYWWILSWIHLNPQGVLVGSPGYSQCHSSGTPRGREMDDSRPRVDGNTRRHEMGQVDLLERKTHGYRLPRRVYHSALLAFPPPLFVIPPLSHKIQDLDTMSYGSDALDFVPNPAADASVTLDDLEKDKGSAEHVEDVEQPGEESFNYQGGEDHTAPRTGLKKFMRRNPSYGFMREVAEQNAKPLDPVEVNKVS